MTKILSFHPDSRLSIGNPIKSVWQEFSSLDIFTKLFIITYLLIIFTTSYIITNYQVLDLHGESESERLQEILRLQEFQRNFYGLSRTAHAVPNVTPATENVISSPEENKGFEIKSFFNWIVNFLKPLSSPFK